MIILNRKFWCDSKFYKSQFCDEIIIKNCSKDMIGINGLGRIGRLILRASFENQKGLTIKAVNDPFMDAHAFAYLLKHDSAHLKFQKHVEVTNNGIRVDGQ